MSMAAILGNLQIVPTRWAFTRHLYNLPLLTVQCSFSVRSLHMAALGRHHTWWRSIMSDAQMAVLNTSCQSSCRSRRRHIGVHCLAFGNPCSANRAVRAFHTRSHTLSGKTNTIPSDGPHRHVQVNKHLVPSDAQRETIYAVATPPGKGGVAVIRISGPHASHVYFRMVRPFPRKSKGKGKEGIEAVLKPRKMVRCTVVDPLNGDELDDGLAVFFNSMASVYSNNTGARLNSICRPSFIHNRGCPRASYTFRSCNSSCSPQRTCTPLRCRHTLKPASTFTSTRRTW